jgi:TRAP transporter TAXI family solute receptor
VLGLASALAAAQGKFSVPVLLSPAGAGPVEQDTLLMVQMVREGTPVTLLPQETPGYIYNIREMANERHWKRTVFATEDAIVQMAMKWGGTPEMKEFLPERVPIKFRLLYGETWWGQGKFFVTFDPNIQNMVDIKGKRVSIGTRSMSDWGVWARLWLDTYGITPGNSDLRYLTPAQITQQLIDGTTDVGVTPLGLEPNMKEWVILGVLRQLEASGKQLRYISTDKAAVDRLNKKYGTTFVHVTVPAGTMPKQTQPVGMGVVRGYKAVHPDFPEEVAYHIVMSVAKIAPKLRDLHPLWKVWSPELMVAGLSDESAHPGAKRAYVELGWWEKTRNYQPMTYPE